MEVRGVGFTHGGDILIRYVDGEVSEEERSLVEEHLEGCPRCREEVVALRETTALLSEAPLLSPPPGFTDRVMARLERKAARGLILRVMPAFAFVIFFLAILALPPLLAFTGLVWVDLPLLPSLLGVGFQVGEAMVRLLSSFSRTLWLLTSLLIRILDPRLLFLQALLALGLVLLWVRSVAPPVRGLNSVGVNNSKGGW